MSGVNIKLKGQRAADIRIVADTLKKEINAELVCENWHKLNEVIIGLLSFEKFYFRNGSYASLTIMLMQNENVQTADIVGSGGGEGIFNISWGANSSFAEQASEVLERYKFKRC